MSSGAGLASAVAVEAHGELGEDIEAVKARGYWEQVWLRLKQTASRSPAASSSSRCC